MWLNPAAATCFKVGGGGITGTGRHADTDTDTDTDRTGQDRTGIGGTGLVGRVVAAQCAVSGLDAVHFAVQKDAKQGAGLGWAYQRPRHATVTVCINHHNRY